MKVFNIFATFLVFLGLCVCKLALIYIFNGNGAFNAFSAKIIRLPHAEISQKYHSTKYGFVTKLAVVYNQQNYGDVDCLDEYQPLCAHKHSKTKFYGDNVALVQTNLAKQPSFLIQGDIYLEQDKILTVQMPRETMLAKVKNIRKEQRGLSALLLISIIMLFVIEIWTFREIKSGRLVIEIFTLRESKSGQLDD